MTSTTVSRNNDRGSPPRILLSSVFGPYARDDEFGSRAINPMELDHNQVTRAQGGFSTFDWFVFGASTDDDLVHAIEHRYPGWTPAHGACRQCAEVYAAVAIPHLRSL